MKDEICNMIEKVARYVDTDSIYVEHAMYRDLKLVQTITGGKHIIQPYDDFICGIRDNCKITAAKLMLNSLYGKKSINSLFKFSEYTGNGEK